MRIYVSPIGRADGSGGSSAAAVSYERALELLTDDVTLVFLPGLYVVDQVLDSTAFTQVCIYGDGKVIFEDEDGQSLPYAMRIGSFTTVSGFRFKNFRSAIQIPDGHTQVLVKNCFEYQLGLEEPDLNSFAFLAGLVTECAFENLTTIRTGPGISAFSGCEVKNCLALAAPAILGELSDGFDDIENWTQLNPLVTFTFQMFQSNFYQGEASLYMAGTNTDGGLQVASFQRTRPVAKSKDLLRGDADKLHLLVYLIDDTGVAASSQAYRYIIGDNVGGEMGFNIPKASLSPGFNFLVFDLQNPDFTVGAIDRSTVTIDRLETDLLPGGSVILQFDYQTLVDDSASYDHNAAELIDGFDVMNFFRGPGGIEATTSPPPFEAPNIEMFKYLPTDPNFVLYTVGGENGIPVGGLWLASHSYTNKAPFHLTFTGHRVISPWQNDESFYDTALGQPGSEGEGVSGTVDQSAVVNSPFNGGTSITDSVDPQDLRATGAEDDNAAQEFGVDNTVDEGGPVYTFPGPFDGTADSAIGLAVEYKLPLGELAKLEPTEGIWVVLVSAGGTNTFQFLPDVLQEGWNDLFCEYANPTFTSGSFDPTAITVVRVLPQKLLAATLVDHVSDHIYRVIVPGASSGAVLFETDGSMILDLTSSSETRVGRAISQPFLVRDVGAFLRAQWQALEDAMAGSLVNTAAAAQELATRTIEYRYSELKYGTYEPVQGTLAQEWRTLNRVNDAPIGGVDLWVQLRMTIRNRVPVAFNP